MRRSAAGSAPVPNPQSYRGTSLIRNTPPQVRRSAAGSAQGGALGSPRRAQPRPPGTWIFISRKVDVRLPGKRNSDSHGAKPVHLIITMIQWIRTSRSSIICGGKHWVLFDELNLAPQVTSPIKSWIKRTSPFIRMLLIYNCSVQRHVINRRFGGRRCWKG